MKNLKIIYINLKQNKERRDHMEKMLSNLNLDYDRFEAICPTIDEIKFGIYKKFYDKACSRFKKYVNNEVTHPRAIGVFGCYLSHLIIHESQLENNNPYMILEDDVKFTTDSLVQLEKITSNYEDWDIIRSLWDSTDKIVKIRGVHWESTHSYKNYDVPHRIFGGSHFSLFRSAEKIFNYLQNENTMPSDSMYSTNLLNVYHSELDVTIVKRFVTNIPRKS